MIEARTWVKEIHKIHPRNTTEVPKHCNRNTEEIQKKYHRNTKEIPNIAPITFWLDDWSKNL